MRHLHHILIALLLLPISLWAEVTIDGNGYSVDTLAHYQVGPGTHYSQLRLTPQGDLIQSVTIGVRANNGNKTLNYSTADLHTGQTNRIIVNLDSLFRADALASEQQWRDNDQAIYPVRLEFATLAFSTDAQKRHYDIPIDGWYLHFREVTPIQSAVDNTSMTPADTQKQKRCTPQGIVILHKGKVYDLLGRPLNNDK